MTAFILHKFFWEAQEDLGEAMDKAEDEVAELNEAAEALDNAKEELAEEIEA